MSEANNVNIYSKIKFQSGTDLPQFGVNGVTNPLLPQLQDFISLKRGLSLILRVKVNVIVTLSTTQPVEIAV